MALSFRPASFSSQKLDKNLVNLIWQLGCQCRCRVNLSTKFRGQELGGFSPHVWRAKTAMKLDKVRVKLAVQAATAVNFHSLADVESPRKGWGLNQEQVAAVETNAKYVRVVAGPGSGKTRVLTHRIAHMITHRNVPPSSILCITFTNKAAKELYERLNNLLDKDDSRQLTVGTFHSVCAKILRLEQVSDYHLNNDYIIYDNDDSERVVKRILEEVVGYFDTTNVSNGKELLNCDPNLGGLCHENIDEKFEQSSANTLLKDLFRCKFLTGNVAPRSQLLEYLEKYDKGKSEKKKSVSADAVRGLLYIIQKARLYNIRTFIAKRNRKVLPYIPSSLNELAFKMAEIYELELRRSNAADFDDLLYIVARLFHNNRHIREKYRKQWRHVLVDEFQDIDEIQYELICLLSIGNKSLFVVGDTDQAIYAWRGANAAHMQYTLEHDFHNIATLKLIRNYRSSRNILNVASALLNVFSCNWQIGSTKGPNLLPMNPSGEPICIKEVSSPYEEADFVAFEIQQLVNTNSASWGCFAILYRTHAQSYLFQSSLTSLRIPYVVVGSIPFYSHKEIKYVLAYLRLVANSENQMVLESIINIPPRGIGKQTLARLKEWASDQNLTLSRALQRIRDGVDTDKKLNVKPKARAGLMQFGELIEGIQSLCHTETIGTIIEAIIERTDFKSYLERLDNSEKEYKKRLERISVLQAIGDSATQKYGTGRRALVTFLEELSLLSNEENTMGDKGECVRLMTLHAAKGLEFDTVFITGMQDGVLPLTDQSIDEESRLFYVGITRAIRRLYCTYSKGLIMWRGKMDEAKPSRFLTTLLTLPELKEAE